MGLAASPSQSAGFQCLERSADLGFAGVCLFGAARADCFAWHRS